MSKSSGFFVYRPSFDLLRPYQTKMSKLKIAVQKSGRLHDDSMKILKAIGISIDNGRDQLKAAARDFPLEVFYLRNELLQIKESNLRFQDALRGLQKLLDD